MGRLDDPFPDDGAIRWADYEFVVRGHGVGERVSSDRFHSAVDKVPVGRCRRVRPWQETVVLRDPAVVLERREASKLVVRPGKSRLRICRRPRFSLPSATLLTSVRTLIDRISAALCRRLACRSTSRFSPLRSARDRSSEALLARNSAFSANIASAAPPAKVTETACQPTPDSGLSRRLPTNRSGSSMIVTHHRIAFVDRRSSGRTPPGIICRHRMDRLLRGVPPEEMRHWRPSAPRYNLAS